MQNETQNNQPEKELSNEQILELAYQYRKSFGKFSIKRDIINLLTYDHEVDNVDLNAMMHKVLGPIFSNNDYFDETSKKFTSLIVSIKNILTLKNVYNGKEDEPDYTLGEYHLNKLEALDNVINPYIANDNRLEEFIRHYVNVPGYKAVIRNINIINLASIRINIMLIDKDENCILRDLFIQVNNYDTIERNNYRVYDVNIKALNYSMSALNVFPIPDKPETGKFFKELIPFLQEELKLNEEEFSNLTIYFFSSINVISIYFFQFNPSMDLYFNREDPFFIIFLPKCLHNQNSRDHKFFHFRNFL